MSQYIPPAGASLEEPPGAEKQIGPPGILADPIDFETGQLLSLENGIDPTDAWVINQLRTVKASGSAVENVGRDFRDVTHVDERSAGVLRQEIFLALQHGIEAKWISEVSVTADTDEDEREIVARVRWHNNFTGQNGKEDLPLNKVIGRK